MRFRTLLFFFMTFISLASSFGQINPPDFQCVRGDTLFWDLPTNNCGPFVGYLVYGSTNENGPFNLIETITSQNQDFYFHNISGNDTWYYYLESDFNCPGEITIESETLDNNAPIIPPIDVVNVDNNNVEINWTPSESPETIGYIIYRITNFGTVPIDTVYNGTSYLDTNADPMASSETYYILALDACGNTSIFDEPHSTIFVSVSNETCNPTLSLNWNLYENWSGGIEQQEVWVSVDGATPVIADTIDATATTYVFEGIDDLKEYCFYINAIETGTGLVSRSNVTCITTDIIQPMRNLWIKNLSVRENNDVEITWKWDTNAEVNTYNIFATQSSSNEYIGIHGESISPPLASSPNHLQEASGANIKPISYYLETIDDCNDLATSNIGSTIFLSGIDQDGVNVINWTAFEIEGGDLIDYDIYRITDDGETFIETVDSSTMTFSDEVDLGAAGATQLCYVVKANALMNFPDGSSSTIKSRSNIYCVEQAANIFIPNAVAPAGRNYEFKPVVQFGEMSNYSMEIFDRWGRKIFETTDIEQGWNGKEDGAFVMPGAYTYLIQLVQASGREVEKKGVVVVIF